MAEAARSVESDAREPTDEEVEAVLAEFDGDPRRAIRALLQDIGTLAEDQRRDVSYAHIYGVFDLADRR
jgi:hypothetical protein